MIENSAFVQNSLYPPPSVVPILSDETINIFQKLSPKISTSDLTIEFKEVRPLHKINEEIQCNKKIISSGVVANCQSKIKLLKIAYTVSIVSCVIACSLDSNNAPAYAIAEFILLLFVYISSINSIKNTNKNIPTSDRFYIHQPDSIDAIIYPFLGLFLNSSAVNHRGTSYFQGNITRLTIEFNSTKSQLKTYFDENAEWFDEILTNYLDQINSDIDTVNNSYISVNKTIVGDLMRQKQNLEKAQDELIDICEYLDLELSPPLKI